MEDKHIKEIAKQLSRMNDKIERLVKQLEEARETLTEKNKQDENEDTNK